MGLAQLGLITQGTERLDKSRAGKRP
jgi:hypothetical protein